MLLKKSLIIVLVAVCSILACFAATNNNEKKVIANTELNETMLDFWLKRYGEELGLGNGATAVEIENKIKETLAQNEQLKTDLEAEKSKPKKDAFEVWHIFVIGIVSFGVLTMIAFQVKYIRSKSKKTANEKPTKEKKEKKQKPINNLPIKLEKPTKEKPAKPSKDKDNDWGKGKQKMEKITLS